MAVFVRETGIWRQPVAANVRASCHGCATSDVTDDDCTYSLAASSQPGQSRVSVYTFTDRSAQKRPECRQQAQGRGLDETPNRCHESFIGRP